MNYLITTLSYCSFEIVNSQINFQCVLGGIFYKRLTIDNFFNQLVFSFYRPCHINKDI